MLHPAFLDGSTAPHDTALGAARVLLDTRSVLFRPEEPFIFTSGRASPVYVDCRRLIAFPAERGWLMDRGTELLASRGVAPDVVAGGETAGIPFAAWMAERMNKPMAYVRKKPKGFGRDARIEGIVGEGRTALLVEDLATDGGSKLSFVEALRDAGAEVGHCFVVFHYGVFPQALSDLKDRGVHLHALTTWHEILAVAEDENRFPAETLAEVRGFLSDPVSWSRAHGGKEDG